MNQELWNKAVQFHGHHCPGLAIGARACEELMKLWNIERAQDEEIVCQTENDACGVDAISALLGCSLGKGNLIYKGTCKQAYSFYDRKQGRSVRFVLKALPELSREERELFIRNAPVEQVYAMGDVRTPCPERARLFGTVICEKCGEGAAEHAVRLEGGKKLCLDCATSYQRGW